MGNPSFQALVESHYESLYRFGLSLSGNISDAADLTQQTFFIWARKGHLLRDERKAKSWLFTTLFREFLKTSRRARRFNPMEEADLEREAEIRETSFVNELDANVVVESLTCVDEVYRVPLTLFYLEDLSYKEIADVLHIPIGTVMSRLARGKNQLRTILSNQASAPEGKIVSINQPKARARSSHE